VDRPVKYGDAPAPSGGVLSKPIGGLGKLTAGIHTLTVLAVTRVTGGWAVILQNSQRECHTETLEHWPLEWQPGTKVVAEVGLTAGFVVYRTVRGFQAVDAETRALLSGVLPSAGDVYLAVQPTQPASTCLKVVTDEHGRRLDARVHPAATSSPAPKGAGPTPGPECQG
jgi:hypothetical protein